MRITKIKMPAYLESMMGVFSFVVILTLAHFFWKFTMHGDESDVIVTFLGLDVSLVFNSMADHVTWVVQKMLLLIGFDPVLENYNVFRYENGNAIRIVWACTGLKQAYIFVLLIALFRGSWKHKIWFIVMGLTVVYIFNILRITILCAIVENHQSWFDLMHGTVLKILFYLVIFLLWVLWEDKVKYEGNMNLKLRKYVSDQLKAWPLARTNYEALAKVESRKISFVGFDVFVQHNPARARSTRANIDAKSISERPCFLCTANRPKQQGKLEYGNYTILLNPYPIFDNHFTIVHKDHVPQVILPYIREFLELAMKMSDYVLFYNGPSCGASAPDHLHFQAVEKHKLPLVNDYFHLKDEFAEQLYADHDYELFVLNGYIRKVYCIESENREISRKAFRRMYLNWKFDEDEEPMMNVYAIYQNHKFYTWIILRDNFRPWQFFEEGDDQIMISPAAVEMAGVLITPVKEHWEKIDRMDVISILEQAGKA